MTKAHEDKWITKKAVYDKLIVDCKALKPLLKARDTILASPKQSFIQKLVLAATNLGIRVVLDSMDLLAKDKSNTKDAVELIHQYTTWFRNHKLSQ